VVCDAAGIKSTGFGRIDIMTSYSFFDVNDEYTERILKSVNGTDFEGNKLAVEVTNSGGGGKSQRKGGGGGDSRNSRSRNRRRDEHRSSGSGRNPRRSRHRGR
jgi:ATP-dependent RNA helicase DeaD